ncbi:MAG: hypothetical protein IJC81_01325 [Clostridia bacterium]|nr:hypothetical protein [Clostridia bacterium]
MPKQKLSGPAIFMYGTIMLTVLISAICFALYYSGIYKISIILWCGIVSFMILYHFGLRILMGEVTKHFKIIFRHPFYKERRFEKGLYKLLKVRKWKDKVLTFEPENYDFENRTLEQLATTMAKSELDHWINEVISVLSLLFIFLWGCPPAFLISAVAAMIFDAQFIIVQRYNRPIVVRLIDRKLKKEKANDEEYANIN